MTRRLWPRVKAGLLALALTLLWVYGWALWLTRGAHRGLEHMLEALIAVVALRLPPPVWLPPAFWLLWRLVRRMRARHSDCVRS